MYQMGLLMVQICIEVQNLDLCMHWRIWQVMELIKSSWGSYRQYSQVKRPHRRCKIWFILQGIHATTDFMHQVKLPGLMFSIIEPDNHLIHQRYKRFAGFTERRSGCNHYDPDKKIIRSFWQEAVARCSGSTAYDWEEILQRKYNLYSCRCKTTMKIMRGIQESWSVLFLSTEYWGITFNLAATQLALMLYAWSWKEVSGLDHRVCRCWRDRLTLMG